MGGGGSIGGGLNNCASGQGNMNWRHMESQGMGLQTSVQQQYSGNGPMGMGMGVPMMGNQMMGGQIGQGHNGGYGAQGIMQYGDMQNPQGIQNLQGMQNPQGMQNLQGMQNPQGMQNNPGMHSGMSINQGLQNPQGMHAGIPTNQRSQNPQGMQNNPGMQTFHNQPVMQFQRGQTSQLGFQNQGCTGGMNIPNQLDQSVQGFNGMMHHQQLQHGSQAPSMGQNGGALQHNQQMGHANAGFLPGSGIDQRQIWSGVGQYGNSMVQGGGGNSSIQSPVSGPADQSRIQSLSPGASEQQPRNASLTVNTGVDIQGNGRDVRNNDGETSMQMGNVARSRQPWVRCPPQVGLMDTQAHLGELVVGVVDLGIGKLVVGVVVIPVRVMPMMLGVLPG
ncbi:hypothetical protein EV426DRAFT_311191 [Tirmania nivea]|nr:hypothetical protein EV426DRAFT_311191 [Tirmania nivea]